MNPLFNVISRETGICYTVLSINSYGNFLIYANGKFQWVPCDNFTLADNKHLFSRLEYTESKASLFRASRKEVI